MENIINRVWAYLRRHWFKVSLLGLVLLACFKKELSVSFDYKSYKRDNQKTNVINLNEEKQKEAEETTPLSIFANIIGSDAKDAEMSDVDEATKIAYLKRFYQVAIKERKKYGIPSSIILANALHQSFAGKRDVAVKLKNNFALPCTFDWAGATDKVGDGCYRRYENDWLSFRDHSVFISSGKFAALRKLDADDYKGWAKGLQKLGYPSVDDDLADNLITIIEKYGLDKLDAL